MVTIEFYRKDVFGRQLIYINGDYKNLLYRLTGRETLKGADIAILRKLGVEMKEVFQPRFGEHKPDSVFIPYGFCAD